MIVTQLTKDEVFNRLKDNDLDSLYVICETNSGNLSIRSVASMQTGQIMKWLDDTSKKVAFVEVIYDWSDKTN